MKIRVETEFSVPMKSEYKALNSRRSAQKNNSAKKNSFKSKQQKTSVFSTILYWSVRKIRRTYTIIWEMISGHLSHVLCQSKYSHSTHNVTNTIGFCSWLMENKTETKMIEKQPKHLTKSSSVIASNVLRLIPVGFFLLIIKNISIEYHVLIMLISLKYRRLEYNDANYDRESGIKNCVSRK